MCVGGGGCVWVCGCVCVGVWVCGCVCVCGGWVFVLGVCSQTTGTTRKLLTDEEMLSRERLFETTVSCLFIEDKLVFFTDIRVYVNVQCTIYESDFSVSLIPADLRISQWKTHTIE